VLALKELGYETIMVNSNPETVSTDYDTADKLYFEPVTAEDVLAILDLEQPDGVIVQFGGQTPLNIAEELEKNGAKIIGTSPDSIALAEDRERFGALLDELNIPQAPNAFGYSYDDLLQKVREITYPVVVRPSFVLGGRAMAIVWNDEQLERFMVEAAEVSPGHPILIDKFLDGATEVDVDALCDGQRVVIAAIMEHVEEAGIHSGDSACSLPPYSLPQTVIAEIRKQTEALARELEVVGLMNIQFAVKDQTVYILEVNPRASRTVPFVSKATGVPLAKIAAKVMAGRKLRDLGYVGEMPELPHMAVKEAVFPFMKFPGVDTILGPEMKSTGEVMGIDKDFGRAFAKAQLAAGTTIPSGGTVFISVRERDKAAVTPVAKRLVDLGFQVVATDGTHKHLEGQGIPSTKVFKVTEGGRPHIVDRIKNREIDLIINTTEGPQAVADSFSIRRTALTYAVPVFTTIAAAHAVADAIAALKTEALDVAPLQEYHKLVKLNLAK
jgi:carbamoyl-phosphate synthase large subunit